MIIRTTAIILVLAVNLAATGKVGAGENVPAQTKPAVTPATEPTPALPLITLAEAQKRATQFYPALRNIDEMIYQADIFIYDAWTMLMPTVSANGSIIRNQQEITMDFPMFPSEGFNPTDPLPMQDVVLQELWGKSFGFSANMSLFNPRSIPAIKIAYDLSDQSRLTAQIQKNELLFAVTSAYYQVHSMQEMIDVARENLTMAEEFLRHSAALKKAGQGTKIDVMRARIQGMDARKELANAEDAHKFAKIALSNLIGIKGDFTIAGPEPVQAGNLELDKLTRKALEARVELKEASLDEQIAKRSETETWMQWLPVFDVTYNWSWNSAAGFAGDKDSWMLIFGAKWDLFRGGSRITQLKTRQSQSRMAQNNQDQLALDIRTEVNKHFQDVTQRKRNVDLAEEQVALAEENHHLVTRQYEVGIVSSLDVLNATTELAGKRISQVLERLQFDIAVLTLNKAVGEYHSLAIVEER